MKPIIRSKNNHPVPEAYSLRDAVNRLFNESVWDPYQMISQESWLENFPSVDLKENKTGFELKADVPGLEPKDLNLEIKEDHIVLSGKKSREEKKETENFHRIERFFGEFRREIWFPAKVDPKKAKAKIKDGILYLELPKSEEEMPQKIEIEKE